MSNDELVLRVFLQLAVILAVCRLVGMIGRRFGQSQVVCEMIAGVLLGPSLLGLLFPDLQQLLFPLKVTVGGQVIRHPSMTILYAISQVALGLYMFLVGLEFDTNLIRGRAKHAGAIRVDPAQHRPGGTYHLANALHHVGADGNCHHPDGLAPVPPALRPPGRARAPGGWPAQGIWRDRAPSGKLMRFSAG